MKEEVIKQGWRRQPGDKEKAIDAKQRQLEEAFRSKEMIREKDELIDHLQKKMTDAAIDIREKGLEIRHLANYTEEIKSKNKKELETQTHYKVANEKSLRRLTEREADVNKHLQEMITLMDTSLTTHGFKARDQRERTYAVNNIDKAKSTLYLLLKMIDEYEIIKQKCKALFEGRRLALLHVGASSADIEKNIEDVNIIDFIKTFTSTKEDNIYRLSRELTTMTDKYEAIEGRAEEAELLRELTHNLKEDIRAKEEVIEELSAENETLKNKAAEWKPKRSVSSPSPAPKKKTVMFPSPAPSNKSSQPKRKKTPFRQVRIKTPLMHRKSPVESGSDPETESLRSELPPTPIPQLKLPTGSTASTAQKAEADTAEQQKKMKLQFQIPTNHNTRFGAVLTQGMYLPPLMKPGQDLRVFGPSGPMAVAKTLNAAHTKLQKAAGHNAKGMGIGGTMISNGNNGYSQSNTSSLMGISNHRSSGQGNTLRVSSLAPSNKSTKRSTISTHFSYQSTYGSHQMPGASKTRGRRTTLWRS